MDLMDTMVLLHGRDGVMIFLTLPFSVTYCSESAAEARADIEVTWGGAGIYSAGGPFGHGVPGLGRSTAGSSAIEVCNVDDCG